MNLDPNAKTPDPVGDPLTDPLTDHAYDGIQEYDNPMPGWWVYLFLATIVFGFFYTGIYLLTPADSSYSAQFELAQARELKKTFGTLGNLEPDEATLVKFSQDPKWIEYGRGVFRAKCASCHGSEGQGINGTNLTDNKYIHVARITDIADVIINGRTNGAMPAHGSTVSKNDIVMLSAFVASLRDTNAPGGKAPEANATEIAPWVAP